MDGGRCPAGADAGADGAAGAGRGARWIVGRPGGVGCGRTICGRAGVGRGDPIGRTGGGPGDGGGGGVRGGGVAAGVGAGAGCEVGAGAGCELGTGTRSTVARASSRPGSVTGRRPATRRWRAGRGGAGGVALGAGGGTGGVAFDAGMGGGEGWRSDASSRAARCTAAAGASPTGDGAGNSGPALSGATALSTCTTGAGAVGSGALAGPSLIRAPRPYGEPPRAVSLATRRALRCCGVRGGNDTTGPAVTSGWASALSGSPNSHSKLAGPMPRLSGVITCGPDAGAGVGGEDSADRERGRGPDCGGAGDGADAGARANVGRGGAGDSADRLGRNSE